MIELAQEDLEFKKSAEFPDKKDNLLEVAYILKLTTDSEIRTQPNASLLEYVATILSWDGACSRISDYVCNRIGILEREQKTNHEIADWLGRLARKIELSPSDIIFKNSTSMPDKSQMELAAQALENSTRKQTLNGEIATGERRSSVGVLLEFMNVKGQRWDGRTENKPKGIEMRRRRAYKDQDRENLQIAKRELNSLLSQYIVNRVTNLGTYEHYSFKEVAQWLRLFIAD